MPARLVKAPPNFFSILFGLAGIAGLWRLMADTFGTPPAVSAALFVLAAIVWLALLVLAIAVRTAIDLRRGGFLPPDPEVIPLPVSETAARAEA